MAVILPPLPYKSPMLRDDGFLSEAWSKWFRQMFSRIGGTEALSNIELEDGQTDTEAQLQADIDDLESAVIALQALTVSHTESIAALVEDLESGLDDLNQGRVL